MYSRFSGITHCELKLVNERERCGENIFWNQSTSPSSNIKKDGWRRARREVIKLLLLQQVVVTVSLLYAFEVQRCLGRSRAKFVASSTCTL